MKDFLSTRPAQIAFLFIKWLGLGLFAGVVCGLLGTFFHHSITFVTGLRGANPWIIYLLPVGGLVISLLYKVTKKPINANQVIKSEISGEPVSILMAPLIVAGTIITQLVGGSSGREGAAIQLGGSLGYNIGRLFKLNSVDLRILTMSGVAAVFSAMFQTPLAAGIFAVEVACAGVIYPAAILPCMTASLSAFYLSKLFGTEDTIFGNFVVPKVSFASMGLTVLLGILIALLSIAFCISIEKCSALMAKLIPNTILRAVIGGAVLLGITLLIGNQEFNGAGMNLIYNAFNGQAEWWHFLLKLLLTVISVSCLFKGGEIVPAMSIGALFGCFFGSLFGINPGFFAAIALVGMFCGIVNCPLAAIMIGGEMFGFEGIVYFIVICAVSYALSGNFSLYEAQIKNKTRVVSASEKEQLS